MAIGHTRLRQVKSKDATNLLRWVNQLPFKIEIKAGPTLENKVWSLFYVLPESDLVPKNFVRMLVIDLD